MQLAGVVGTPGGVGGGTLGLGIVLKLHDQFSKQAVRVDRQMRMLGNRSDQFVQRMDQGLHAMSAGLGTIAVGAGVLGTLAFPLRDAINFEEAIAQTFSIMEDQSPKAKKNLEDLALRLGAMFPEDATQMSAVLKNILAAGIEDLDSAGFVAEVSTKLALPTDSNVTDVTNGMLSMLQAYGLVDKAVYTTDRIRENVNEVGDKLLATSKIARFSDTSVSDMAAYAKQIGQIAPIAQTMGIDMDELLAFSAVGTLTGQNARRMTTGLRQSFSDMMNAQRGQNSRLKGFLAYVEERGLTDQILDDGIINIPRYIQKNSLRDYMKLATDYVTSGNEDPQRIAEILNSKNAKRQLAGLAEKAQAGLINEGTKLEESPEMMNLVNSLSGAIDINKAKELFPSVWGLLAALPLMGPGLEKIDDALKKIRGSAGSVDYAFEEIMNTVKMQWQKLTSQISTLNIMWGRNLLPAVNNTLRTFNALIDVLIIASDKLGWFIEPLLTAAAYMGIFLAAMGATMAAAGGLQALNAFIASNAAEAGVFSKFLGGSLATALWRVTWITLGLVAAQKLLGYAWNTNLFGIADITRGWYLRLSKIFGGVKELLTNMNWATGMSEMSKETRDSLKSMGLLEFVYKLTAVLYRVGIFFKSFGRGFNDTLKAFRDTLQEMFGGLANGLRAMGILPRVTEWLENLINPTQANVEAFRSFGRTMGRIAAGLAIIGSAVASLAIFGVVSRMVWVLNGGFLGLLTTLAPFAAVLGGLAGAGWLIRRAFDTNWMGFADYVNEHFPRMGNLIGNFGEVVGNFVKNFQTGGIGAAIKGLSLELTGLLPEEIVRNTRYRLDKIGEAIRYFPRNLRLYGWGDASRNFLETMFGNEQGQEIYANIDRFIRNTKTRFLAFVDFLKLVPGLIESIGWRRTFALVFQRIMPNSVEAGFKRIRQIAINGFSSIAAQFFMWIGRMGWSEYWMKAQEIFDKTMTSIRNGWTGLRQLVNRIWTDLKTNVNWNDVAGGAVVALSSLASFVSFVFGQIIASAEGLYFALTTKVDWENIQGLIGDVNSLLRGTSDSINKVGNPNSGWNTFWTITADTLDIVVTSLRSVVQLMDAIFSFGTPEFFPKMGKALGTEADAFGQIISNPVAGIGAFVVFDILLGKLGKLFKGAKETAGGFRLIRGTLGLVRKGFMGLFNLITGNKAIMNGLRFFFFRIRYILVTGVLPAIRKLVTSGLIGWVGRLGPMLTGIGTAIATAFGAIAGTIAAPILISVGVIAGAILLWKTDFLGLRTWIQNLDLWSSIGESFKTMWQGMTVWMEGFMPKFRNGFRRVENWMRQQSNALVGPFGGYQFEMLEMENVPAPKPPAPKPAVQDNTDKVAASMAALRSGLRSGPTQPTRIGLTVPGLMDARRGDKPQVRVEGYTAEQNAMLRESLMPLYNAMRTQTSEGGEIVTEQERSVLTSTLMDLVGILENGITATTPPVILDGRDINRAGNSAARRAGQLGKNSGGR